MDFPASFPRACAARSFVVLAGAVAGLALASAAVAADDHALARFRGPGRADPIRVTNVRGLPGPVAGQGTIVFDLA